MSRDVLVKPLITEKTERFAEDLSLYGFIVRKDANKLQIKRAIQGRYNVKVKSIKTLILPGKSKTKQTKSGVSRGQTSPIKKAYVRLVDGDVIDLYS